MRFPSIVPRPLQSFARLAAATLFAGLALSAVTQQPGPNSSPDPLATQREAMQKLGFLVGRWSGPITVVRGPGEPLHLTQSEDIQFKLDGLVLLIEGASRDADGKVPFHALATIAYDDASHSYRFRAYNDGRYLDTELTVVPNGFSWGYAAGPVHIVNSMHLTAKGEWAETTDVAIESNPPHRSVDMLLQHQP
jgi:hypothetical protein